MHLIACDFIQYRICVDGTLVTDSKPGTDLGEYYWGLRIMKGVGKSTLQMTG